MPNSATVREQRLRKTKAQLIDEIDTLELRAAATPEGGSELKRRDKELAEKQAQLRVALDNMPGGIMLVDKDRNYVFFNSRYCELHDFPEGLLKVGESMRVEDFYQAERGDFGPGDKDDLIEQVGAPTRRAKP
jgi:PAS domain-containing protein